MRYIKIITLFLIIIAASNIFGQTFGNVIVSTQWFEGGQVDFVVEDSQGRREGRDLIKNIDYDEIPNASYVNSGIASNVPNQPSIEGLLFSFNKALRNTFFEENYKLVIFSNKPTLFDGYVSLSQTFKTGASFEFKGVLDTLKTLEYEFNFSTDSTEELTFTKKVNNQVFAQDLDLCYELQLIKTDTVYNSLKDNLDEYESYWQQGDIKNAGEVLSQFLENLSNMKSSQRTLDAVAILKVDVERLQEKLIQD